MYSAPFSDVTLTDGIPRQRLPWAPAGHASARWLSATPFGWPCPHARRRRRSRCGCRSSQRMPSPHVCADQADEWPSKPAAAFLLGFHGFHPVVMASSLLRHALIRVPSAGSGCAMIAVPVIVRGRSLGSCPIPPTCWSSFEPHAPLPATRRPLDGARAPLVRSG